MTFFDRLYDSRSGFDGSILIHTLSRNGMVVVPEDSLGWGFAFAFDLAATTSELAGTASSSCGLARLWVLYFM